MAKMTHKHRHWMLVIIIVVLATVAGFLIWKRLQPQTSVIPQEIASQATFPLYVARDLPDKFTINEGSYRIEEGVVLFEVTGPEGEKIYITQQAKPKDFDFDDFYMSRFFKSYEQLTPAGKAVFGVIDLRTRVFSIQAGDTWIFANTDLETENNTMESIASGLKPN